jgi:hypothetical protein
VRIAFFVNSVTTWHKKLGHLGLLWNFHWMVPRVKPLCVLQTVTGKQMVESERLKLTQNLATGLIITLVKNIQPGAVLTLSMAVATPKPQVVRVVIT